MGKSRKKKFGKVCDNAAIKRCHAQKQMKKKIGYYKHSFVFVHYFAKSPTTNYVNARLHTLSGNCISFGVCFFN